MDGQAWVPPDGSHVSHHRDPTGPVMPILVAALPLLLVAISAVAALGLVSSSGPALSVFVFSAVFATIWIPFWLAWWCYEWEVESDGTLHLRCVARTRDTAAYAVRSVKMTGGENPTPWVKFDGGSVAMFSGAARVLADWVARFNPYIERDGI